MKYGTMSEWAFFSESLNRLPKQVLGLLLFTRRMSFLSPNQQCRTTDGKRIAARISHLSAGYDLSTSTRWLFVGS